MAVRLRRTLWRLANVIEVVAETPRTKSLLLEFPGWEGHKAGQHVDVRLTAEDSYQAQRSYSIASAPEDERLMLAVDRLVDGARFRLRPHDVCGGGGGRAGEPGARPRAREE